MTTRVDEACKFQAEHVPKCRTLCRGLGSLGCLELESMKQKLAPNHFNGTEHFMDTICESLTFAAGPLGYVIERISSSRSGRPAAGRRNL